MEDFTVQTIIQNGTNGTYQPDRNLTSPMERTSQTEVEPPINVAIPPVDSEAMKLQNTLLFMQTYASPLIFCTGIPLNLISLAIVTRGCLQKTSMVQYLCTILMTDVTLLANLFMVWLTQRGFDLYRLGALCHFTLFLSHTSSFLSLWITVGLAVDGYTRICFPKSAKLLCTIIRSRVVILCLVACATAVYLNLSLMVGVLQTPTGHMCAPVQRYANTLRLLDKADIFINLMLPYIGLIYLLLHVTVKLLVDMYKSPQSHRKVHLQTEEAAKEPFNMQHTEGNKDVKSKGNGIRNQTKDQPLVTKSHFARLCLCVVFFTLCLNLPSAVLRTYNTFKPMTVFKPRAFTWQQLLQYPYYLKSACNFFILLLGYPKFRHIAVRLPVDIVLYLGNKLRRNPGQTSETRNGRERVSIEADPEDPQT